MTSFFKMWENLTANGNDEDAIIMSAIRNGLNVDEDFWDKFIQVTNNSHALGKLLDIKPEKIASWGAKIKRNLDKFKKSNENDGKTKKKVINTGRNLAPEISLDDV